MRLITENTPVQYIWRAVLVAEHIAEWVRVLPGTGCIPEASPGTMVLR